MKVHLINFAATPAPGVYRAQRVTAERFAELLQEAHRAGQLESYIGFETTCDLLEVMSGVPVEKRRIWCTDIEDGDVLLFARLKRHDVKSRGGQTPVPSVNDYDFLIIRYCADGG